MTQRIPVTRDGKKGSDILVIDSTDVLKIEKIRDREYMVHTKDNQYYLDTSLDSIEEWLYEDGFRLLDNSNIVNMNRVQDYDARKGMVYLGDPSHKRTKTASAAWIHKEHIETVMRMLNSAKADRVQEDLEPYLLKNKEIEVLPYEEDDKFSRSYATIRAMNERRKAEEKIVHMAYHDSLTNLPNRLLFNDRMNQAFQRAREAGKQAAIIFFDLDRFKVINDTLGHHVGDQLLRDLAKKLKSFVREQDVVARYSGDEFMILMHDIAHIDEVTEFVKGLPKVLREPFIYDEQELFVTASIGITLFPDDGTDGDTLIKNADIAMYRAKEKGGNNFQLYHPEMNKRSLHRLNLEIHLRKAVEKEEFHVYYQPLVDLGTGKIFGMESLVRWKHPEWGMVSPGEFIPLAEETGLIVPLGSWVLKEACKQTYAWSLMGYPRLCVSVNISMNQFHQPNFVQLIEDTLRETKLHPSQLCLEITETVAMKNVSYIMETMENLKKIGVQISIDDFGTGYSSLSYLKKFRVHTLKIDQSFIRDITVDEDSAAIVTALIAMSRKLKIKSLAEGVETPEQLRFLKDQGCDEIQGYIFSTPLAPDQFEELMKKNKLLQVH
ncbi:EAL domain-containing protein [Paenibacillus chartarius]|uniref:EAL domain-containing protein n=1 Tax=Paenibacillus chartarius TaxID=747481 RepID=A0ABV6DRS7_9BACL